MTDESESRKDSGDFKNMKMWQLWVVWILSLPFGTLRAFGEIHEEIDREMNNR